MTQQAAPTQNSVAGRAIRKTIFVLGIAAAAIIIATLPATFPFIGTVIQVIAMVAVGLSGYVLVAGTLDLIIRGRRSVFARTVRRIVNAAR